MGKRRRSGCFVDSGAKKSDGWDSQEEIDTEGGALKGAGTINGVRYSARVMEKQEKLRRESSPGKTVLETGPALSVTISTPAMTSRSRDESGCMSGMETVEEPLSPSPPHSVEKRKKRNWELWSQDDKQLFFEALNEFGKDFEAIQNHLASKLKGRNKGPTPSNLSHLVPKNKDQVRHFYYRTWNKISKFLTFPKDMKKAFQELYGLINYGELRKKQRVLNMKSAVKLSELVDKGTTTIKVRGKTCRIKTPVCRALKRLNRLEDVEPARMPHKVVVELVAKDGKTWRSVQALAHNPRIRVTLSLQRTLASVISFFEDRWKSPQDRLKEQLIETFGGRSVPRLRFVPVQRPEISFPIFKVSEATSSAKISLRAYTENVLKRFGSGESSGKKNATGRTRNPSEHGVPETDVFEEAKVENGDLPATGDAPAPSIPKPQPKEEVTDETTVTTGPTLIVCACPTSKAHGVDDDFLSHVWDDDNVRRGWTAAEAGIMTFGELYLMLGQCEKIELEYYWDGGGSETQGTSPSLILDALLTTATIMKKKKSLRSKNPPIAPAPTITCPNCSHSHSPGRSGSFSSAPPPNPVLVPPPTPQGSIPPPPNPRIGLTAIAPAPSKETFRRPSPPRTGPEQKVPPPKPFLVLPKGNRRLGRPANKRVVIPRVLPLRPKITEPTTVLTIPTLKPVLLTSHILPMGPGPSQKPVEPAPISSLEGQRIDAGAITLGTNEFQDLLKMREKSSSSVLDGDNSFSLSSFMDISLPESSKNQATACLNSDKFLTETADAELSNSCLSLAQFMDPMSKGEEEQMDRDRDKKLGEEENSRAIIPSLSQGPWLSSTDTGDLSLNSLLITLDNAQHNLPATESGSDMTFQSLVGQGEGNLNFLTKFSQEHGESSRTETNTNR